MTYLKSLNETELIKKISWDEYISYLFKTINVTQNVVNKIHLSINDHKQWSLSFREFNKGDLGIVRSWSESQSVNFISIINDCRTDQTILWELNDQYFVLYVPPFYDGFKRNNKYTRLVSVDVALTKDSYYYIDGYEGLDEFLTWVKTTIDLLIFENDKDKPI